MMMIGEYIGGLFLALLAVLGMGLGALLSILDIGRYFRIRQM